MDLQQYCLRWTHHHTNLQVMFYQLLERGYFCDVTLACEGQTIRAHRVVLCACSTYFANLLTNVNIEKDPIIIMREEKFKEVKCLIEFMYKGEIYVEQSAIAALLQTAASLGIKGLTEVSRQNDYYRANNLNQDTIKSHDSCLSGGNDPDMHVTEHDSNVYAYETDNDDISSHNTTENYDTNKPDRNTNCNTALLGTTVQGNVTLTREVCSWSNIKELDKKCLKMPSLTPFTVFTGSKNENCINSKKKRGRPPLDKQIPPTAQIPTTLSHPSAPDTSSCLLTDAFDQQDNKRICFPSFSQPEPKSPASMERFVPQLNYTLDRTPSHESKFECDAIESSYTRPKANCNEYNEHSLPSPRELISPSDCKQWKDVVKMNEYLVHGKRPQFWEESFTKRILHGIKNKEIEMKHAAKILGVSYGTLYGRYRETYGSLKHAYRSSFEQRGRKSWAFYESNNEPMMKRDDFFLSQSSERLSETPAMLSTYGNQQVEHYTTNIMNTHNDD